MIFKLHDYNNVFSKRHFVIEEIKELNEYKQLHSENMFYLNIDFIKYMKEQKFYHDNVGIYIGNDKNKYGVKKFYF
jgi:hypothetical protein